MATAATAVLPRAELLVEVALGVRVAGGELGSRMCQVRRIDARHRLEEWIDLDLYALPMGGSLQDEAGKVHAAAHAHWRELRRLPTGEVLQC